ncbi:MAG: hypothetical protein CXT67_03690 [Methanobacteriota archaeon]|nr:MAG: hypothetical protein CXT67_03690 [Euryarchaeota archaeon]HIG19397.1 hypothetical protein [Candidatus Poseidoniales archaeon]
MSMRFHWAAIAALVALLLVAGTVTADDDDDDDDGILGDTGKGLGTAAAWGLAFSTTIIIWKPGLKYIRANADKIVEDGLWLKKELGKANRWYLKIHYWVGASAVLVGFIHGVSMNKWEVLFWGGWVGMLFMSVTGSLLLWKWPPRKVKKGARLLHAQRAVLVITIVLLFVSHEFFD